MCMAMPLGLALLVKRTAAIETHCYLISIAMILPVENTKSLVLLVLSASRDAHTYHRVGCVGEKRQAAKLPATYVGCLSSVTQQQMKSVSRLHSLQQPQR